MSAAMNKENLINQLPSSPYTPTQKVRSTKRRVELLFLSNLLPH